MLWAIQCGHVQCEEHRCQLCDAWVQSNFYKLLSKEVQDLMLQQSIYIDQCAGLATHLESVDDKALSAALDSVDTCWAEFLSAVESVKHGLGLFMLFNSMHAPPSHWMWYLLGGVKLSLVVRSRFDLPLASCSKCLCPHLTALGISREAC
jgi:hypothetical protein